jgi:hypothetical protein
MVNKIVKIQRANLKQEALAFEAWVDFELRRKDPQTVVTKSDKQKYPLSLVSISTRRRQPFRASIKHCMEYQTFAPLGISGFYRELLQVPSALFCAKVA